MSERPRIVVVGSSAQGASGPIGAVRTVCSDYGCEPTLIEIGIDGGNRGALSETDAAGAGTLLVTIGSEAFRSVVDEEPECPVLPIGTVAGVRSVPLDAAEPALRSAVGSSTSTLRHPVLSVSSEGEPIGTLFWDCSVCTAAPARISEFRVGTPDRSNLETVRADGVVAATPAGSGSYASAVGGPLVAPETGLAVVPIAPFQRAHDRWVVPVTQIDITVRRDEVPISVRLDGAERTRLDGTGRLSIQPEHETHVLQVPESTLETEGR